MAAHFFAPLWSKKSNQSRDPWYLKDRVLLPILLREHNVKLLATGLGWEISSWCFAKKIKLTKINCNLLSKFSPGSCKSSIASRVPNNYIRQILPVELSRCGNKFLVLPTLSPSQNPLLDIFLSLWQSFLVGKTHLKLVSECEVSKKWLIESFDCCGCVFQSCLLFSLYILY